MNRWSIVAVLASIALLAAACGNAPDDRAADTGGTTGGETSTGGGDGDLSGSIAIDGSSTVAPLTDAVAEEYAAERPDVTVNLSVSGTGGGFERFCAGDTQISNASRPITQEEADTCAENGIEFTEVRVGTDALTMVTHPETGFVDCLTQDEVVRIWGPDGVSNWSEVRDGFPDEQLQIFAPGSDSGTYDFFNETVLEPNGIEEPRQDFNASEDDNIIAQGIIGTPGSWGFFGYAYYQENTESVKALEYDAGDGCVAPAPETAQDDSYKLARPLFIYVKNSALAEPHVADFVTFYLETVNDLIDEIGYIAASDETIAEAQAKVEQAISDAG
ncbi:MAG: PstS family phosphate ABC transporter substrate-binding protein [Actinobacteria bacterium]|nr:PstS family phosphate ABC transporter substrate-binding protein [Actinomycetota bacterium]